MCKNRLKIGKNAKGYLLEVDSDFPEICTFQQMSEIVSLRPEDDVTEDLTKDKVVGNFHSFHLSPRTAQSEVRSSRNTRFTEGQLSDYGIPNVGDVIDSNSYQTWRIQPSHDFGTSLRI